MAGTSAVFLDLEGPELPMRLGIPVYGADPKDSALGTKSQSRRLFAEAGVPHPPGREDLRSRNAQERFDATVAALSAEAAAAAGL